MAEKRKGQGLGLKLPSNLEVGGIHSLNLPSCAHVKLIKNLNTVSELVECSPAVKSIFWVISSLYEVKQQSRVRCFPVSLTGLRTRGDFEESALTTSNCIINSHLQ